MKSLKLPFLMVSLMSLTGCQMGYLVKSSYDQLALLAKARDVDRVLKDPNVDEETKRKIKLVQEVKKFSEEKIGLVHTRNYDKFVKLEDRYVTYVVTASPKDHLESYLWSFPIVGKVPYKGFFRKADAEEEKTELEKKSLDVGLRGVSAYSTLGWFADPLLSSMTAYEDAELVDTIIHETTHATIYIKSNADFNERLAMFVGTKGMEQFYQEREGASSQRIVRSRLLAEDARVFAKFVSGEIKNLEDFYSQHKNSATLLTDRQKAFEDIKSHFKNSCVPLLKTDSYKGFDKQVLNNAILMGYRTYYQDLHVFELAFDKLKTWPEFMAYFKKLKGSEDPEKELRTYVQ